jgi:hypothetical protein
MSIEDSQDPFDERVAAEDFRRQIQERFARPTRRTKEETLRWLDENQAKFAEIMSQTFGGAADTLRFVEVSRRLLEQVELGNPHDDLLTHSVVDAHCKEIEETCRRLEIPLRSGVAYGSTDSLEADAARYAVPFTEASVVSLSSGLILFCSDLSKVFSRSLIYEPGGSRFSLEPSDVYAKVGADPDLKMHWTEVIGGYGYGSGPLNVTHRVVPLPAAVIRQQLLWAMERFAVAHEYAHHIAAHGRREFVAKGADDESANEEHEADLFAFRLTQIMGADDKNIWAVSGAGPVVLLKSLHCVRQARQVLSTGLDTLPPSSTHPPISERLESFEQLDFTVREDQRTPFRKLRRNVATIIDLLWPKLLNYLLMMREHGLRPESDFVGFDL